MLDTILSALFIFLTLLYISWFVMFFYPKKKTEYAKVVEDITVIIPAHNEEKFIGKTIESLLSASYPGEIEVMVVNDMSTDGTARIVTEISKKDKRVTLYNADKHIGKSNAVNFALKKARNNIVLILDADSEVEENALLDIVKPFGDKKVGGVSGVLRAKQNRNPLTWFQDLEYILASGSRYLFDKFNGTYFLPGFAAFRKKALEAVGGFSKSTFSEDLDIGILLKKAGYKLVMSDAIVHTRVPETITGLVTQRMRWCIGTIQVIKKHSDILFNRKYGLVGVYCIPLQLFWYFYSVLYLPIVAYQIFGGYLTQFANYSNYFSIDVVKYFFNWLSVYGMFDYVYNVVTGIYPSTLAFYTLVAMFILYMIYNLLMMNKFSKLSLRFLVVLSFLFPYYLMILSVHIISLVKGTLTPTVAVNRWEKAV